MLYQSVNKILIIQFKINEEECDCEHGAGMPKISFETFTFTIHFSCPISSPLNIKKEIFSCLIKKTVIKIEGPTKTKDGMMDKRAEGRAN